MADKAKKPAEKGKKPAKGGGGGADIDLSPKKALGPVLGFLLPVILLATWCLVTWNGGPQLHHRWNGGDTRGLCLALGGAGLAVCAVWVLLPVAHWVRIYPIERFTSGSKVAWFVPMVAATPVWIALYGLVLGALALGGYAAWTGLHELGLPERIHALSR